jgi:uncharacterized membrane protein
MTMTTTVRATANTTFRPDAEIARESHRVRSLDIARGLVMILMAIDHVRVYSGVPAGSAAFGVFFTRWITHFAAPGFAFFAGTGAFLYGRKVDDRRALGKYLAVRGVMLIALELTVLREAWTFNLDFAHYNLAGVIWMLGWCMILMAALVQLPPMAVGILGVLLMIGQDAFNPIGAALPAAIGKFLYLGGAVELGTNGPPILILYVIVPWIGVMAAGYWFGTLMTRPLDERQRACKRIGWSLTLAFIVIAGAMVATHPASGANAPPALLRMLNQRKYPASQLFLLMTLGPMLLFLAYAEQMRGAFGRVLATYGRVPLFYYLLHIPLIHCGAVLVPLIRDGRVNPWLFANHPLNPGPVPAGYRWSLGLLYLVFAIDVAALYIPCRWFATLKTRDRSGLLRFL